MFSSNQRLEVSGRLSSVTDVFRSLKFALSSYNDNELELNSLYYQITNDGKFCVGCCYVPVDCWSKVEQESLEDFASKIYSFLREQEVDNPYKYADGSSHKGFLMKAIPESLADDANGIKKPFYGIVSFESFYSYYSQ